MAREKRHYSPIGNNCLRTGNTSGQGFPPQVLRQSDRGMRETPRKHTVGFAVKRPATYGDRTAREGRYEKGRIDKSRS